MTQLRLRILAQMLAWFVLACAAWLVLASGGFLWLSDLLHDPRLSPLDKPWAWLRYARAPDGSLLETAYLALSAVLGAVPPVVAARVVLSRPGGLSALTGAAQPARVILRGASDNHGHADWMTDAEQRALFPSEPDLDIGGVVLGERDRVDLGPARSLRMNPRNPATWGNGGAAPLMIDPCREGSTHSIVISGPGGYKTSALAATCLTWTRSMVVLDPACELNALVGDYLAATGRTVHMLRIGDDGFNVLDCIDLDDPLAETRIHSVVARIVGPMPTRGGDNGSDFKEWGKVIITALLAHMMFDPDIPREMKTLRLLRAGLTVGDETMREVLWSISEHSPSSLARDLARQMRSMVEETYSGALGNATRDTAWLSTEAYADMVSGSAFHARDLARGDMAVMVQVPMEALLATPAVARVVIGSLLDAVIAAGGKVQGRVLFPIDEAVLLGAEPALKVARDQGRKFRITMQLYYQSEGQIEEVWTRAGKNAWYDGVSWRQYANIRNLESARDLAAVLGTYGARAFSEGKNAGTSGRIFEASSASKGSNTNEHEVARDLAKVSELLADMRADERITLYGNARPIRHGAAIAFRRPAMQALLGDNPFTSGAGIPPRAV